MSVLVGTVCVIALLGANRREFIVAIGEADRIGASVLLGDRDAKITLQASARSS